MRFETFLRQSAQRFPDKTALVAGGRRLTYSQLDDLSDAEQERKIDHAVGGLGHRLRDPEPEKRVVGEDRAKGPLRCG